MKKPISVIFRDINPHVVKEVAKIFPDWDCKAARIFDDLPAVTIHAAVSPANCIGRMDGGVDAAYSYQFGYQLQDRLMRQITLLDNGILPIGEAKYIHTHSTVIPFLISAPTMAWPPRYIGATNHAYLAFKAALKTANELMENESLSYIRLLLPGLGTGTGGIHPSNHAFQLKESWDEFYEIS